MQLLLPKKLAAEVLPIAKLIATEYGGSTHLVGGGVRDILLGIEPKDVDLEVYGVTYKKLSTLLKTHYGKQVKEVGKSFGIFKLALANFEIDIALPRTESKVASGHRGFLVRSNPYLSVKEASKRRDFTINAIAYNPLTKELLDSAGGIRDIKNRILKVASKVSFREDPLRLYRALQLTARFSLTPTPDTVRLLKQMVVSGELESLSRERITEELKKLLLLSKKPSAGLVLAKDIGLLKKYYPELNTLITTPQDQKWHPEGTVWSHTLLTVDSAAKLLRTTSFILTQQEKFTFMLGALFHDLGKATTTIKIKKRIHSPGHELAGKQIWEKLSERLALPAHVKKCVGQVIAEHSKPRSYFYRLKQKETNKNQYIQAVRSLLLRLAPTPWQILALVNRADMEGRGIKKIPVSTVAHIKLFVSTVLSHKLEKASTLITGKDILTEVKKAQLPIPRGPEFRNLINKIEHLAESGTVSTKKEAVQHLKLLLQSLQK